MQRKVRALTFVCYSSLSSVALSDCSGFGARASELRGRHTRTVSANYCTVPRKSDSPRQGFVNLVIAWRQQQHHTSDHLVRAPGGPQPARSDGT
jgi:hypothetical protein